VKSFKLWSFLPLVGLAGLSIGFTADQLTADQLTESIFAADPELVERGRYVALVAGCNDCHTPGYAVSGGEVPEALWLTGDNFGWRGPWGTTYGTNLRLFINDMTETQWIQIARTLRRRPPMPWFNLNAMHEDDLRALYHFMRSLGNPGLQAPAALPPEQEPATAYAMWIESTESDTP
jgi:mono/diheme cytochrome c family protein